MKDQEIVYEGKIIQVIQWDVKEGDKEKTFEMARRSPGTRLIILTQDKKHILLTKEFRHEHNTYDYRLPGGKVFDTLSEYSDFLNNGGNLLEKAQEAAKKEAREEAGIEPRSISPFHTSVAGATVQWDLLYFVVDDYDVLEKGQSLEMGEDIQIVPVELEQVKELCLSNKDEMKEDRSVAVLLKFLHTLDIV